ncbi:MAG: 3-oxoacyl-acyl-carrier-protein synthase II [Bacillota bacterium]|nr:MAG: 3-oxoacyl-acyl-carrier-protein synthase II [Bacillota bacterium]MBS3951024.1 beta-ketoacyl-ACP synthase II [Peptococcaceae bacterium]
MRRVVITGLGVVSPIGIGQSSFWQAALAGKSGVGRITRFDTTGFATQIAAEVKDFDPGRYMDKKEAKRMDRFAQYGVAASLLALQDSGLTIDESNAEDVGVYVSAGIGGLETLENQCLVLKEKGPGKVSPFFVPMMIGNMAAGQIAIAFGLKGPSSDIVTACASGAQAVGDAFRVIERGDSEVMLAGGAEGAITPLAIAGFNSARALSTRNDSPETASRPFDKERDGFVMGEGAGVLVIESLDHALARGANIYAEVRGYAATNDAFHITSPDPEARGVIRCLRKALKDAKLEPQDIDYINAHGTSTDLNDKLETRAIKEVFGDHAAKLAVSSTKSMVGHLLGAAGGVELIATALSIHHGKVHPTINLMNPDPECDLDYVANRARELPIRAAMKNSLGFGGHNCTVVLAKYNG